MSLTRLITAPLAVVAVFGMALILCTGPALADDAQLGRDLVNKFFTMAQANDVAALDKYLAPGFQSVHDFGASDKAHELELMKNLKLTGFELSDFRTTRTGSTLVVTYRVKAHKEVLKSKKMTSRPAMRMTIFTKTDSCWLMTGHANLAAPVK